MNPISQRRKILVEALKIFDLLSCVACLLLAAALCGLPVGPVGMDDFFSMQVKIQTVALALAFLFLWCVILSTHLLYASRRLSSVRSEAFDVLRATLLGTAVLFVFAWCSDFGAPGWRFFLVFWGANCSVTVVVRVLLRHALRRSTLKGFNQRRMVIVGTNERAVQLACSIQGQPDLGYDLVGFVDDSTRSQSELDRCGFRLVADFAAFPCYLRNQVVDEVMICLPVRSHYSDAAYIASLCEEHGVVVRFCSEIFDLRLARSRTESFQGHPIVTLYTGHMEGGAVVAKRLLDVAGSLALIALLSPLLLLTSLAVKLSSRGPVLFVQERLGRNKRHIRVYKFRTMYPDAEARMPELERLNEMSGPVFKIRDDPRVTPIGKYLRKFSIDELPQLFNVLKGDMSLVGPRPLALRDCQGFEKDWHRRRFSVRPGITCLWQVQGRNNIPFERWMELDMEYIDTWSLWLDLKILLRTLPAVLKGSGAA